MVQSLDVTLPDGRTLFVHDAGRGDEPDALTIVWHHGSPQTGALLPPLLAAAEQRAIRLLSFGRPSYGGSAPYPHRDVASAGDDVLRLADALGVGRYAVMGASGGGPHALACAAVAPERTVGVVCLAGPAPFTRREDWFAGMISPGGLRAAPAGRAVRERFAQTDEFDPAVFTAPDWAALEGEWAPLGQDAQRAEAQGPDGLIDDDVAFTSPWGFDLAAVTAPVLLVQGGQDRVIPPTHAEALLGGLPRAELWSRPEDGHISVLDACPEAMDWLLAQASAAG